MSTVGKDLSAQIMEAVKPLLPKNVGFVMISGDMSQGDLGIVSNLPDDLLLELLAEAVLTIRAEPAESLESSKTERDEFSN